MMIGLNFKTCSTEMTKIDGLKTLEKQKSKLASKPFCLEGKQKNKFYSLVVFQVLGGKSSLKNERNSKIKIIIFKRQLIIKLTEKKSLRPTSSIKSSGFSAQASALLSIIFSTRWNGKYEFKPLHFMLETRYVQLNKP